MADNLSFVDGGWRTSRDPKGPLEEELGRSFFFVAPSVITFDAKHDEPAFGDGFDGRVRVYRELEKKYRIAMHG